MNRVIALDWAEDPLDFSVFLPAQVTVPVGALELPLGADETGAELLAPELPGAELLGAAVLDAAAVLVAALVVLLLLAAVPLLLLPQADRINPAAATRLTAATAERLSFT